MMEYHTHKSVEGYTYTHRHEGWEVPHVHDEIRVGTIVNVGMAQETNVGRREVKSG